MSYPFFKYLKNASDKKKLLEFIDYTKNKLSCTSCKTFVLLGYHDFIRSYIFYKIIQVLMNDNAKEIYLWKKSSNWDKYKDNKDICTHVDGYLMICTVSLKILFAKQEHYLIVKLKNQKYYYLDQLKS